MANCFFPLGLYTNSAYEILHAIGFNLAHDAWAECSDSPNCLHAYRESHLKYADALGISTKWFKDGSEQGWFLTKYMGCNVERQLDHEIILRSGVKTDRNTYVNYLLSTIVMFAKVNFHVPVQIWDLTFSEQKAWCKSNSVPVTLKGVKLPIELFDLRAIYDYILADRERIASIPDDERDRIFGIPLDPIRCEMIKAAREEFDTLLSQMKAPSDFDEKTKCLKLWYDLTIKYADIMNEPLLKKHKLSKYELSIAKAL